MKRNNIKNFRESELPENYYFAGNLAVATL